MVMSIGKQENLTWLKNKNYINYHSRFISNLSLFKFDTKLQLLSTNY